MITIEQFLGSLVDHYKYITRHYKIEVLQVSDGIIAPGYTPEALEVLKKKKNGGYCVLQIADDYVPSLTERKVLFGLTMEQRRNDAVIDRKLFNNVVTENKNVSYGCTRCYAF